MARDVELTRVIRLILPLEELGLGCYCSGIGMGGGGGGGGSWAGAPL